MLLPSPLPRLRRLRSALSDLRTSRYTATEVRALLDPRADRVTARGTAVLAAAAVPSSWTAYVGQGEAAELGHAAVRLPTILFWHRAGHSADEIGRRLGLFGGPHRAERALEVAAGCIAARLNDHGQAAVRGIV
jgi:hypothetical protein